MIFAGIIMMIASAVIVIKANEAFDKGSTQAAIDSLSYKGGGTSMYELKQSRQDSYYLAGALGIPGFILFAIGLGVKPNNTSVKDNENSNTH